MTPTSPKKIVKIEWSDSTFRQMSWQDLDEGKALVPEKITTVGVVIKETKSAINLAMSCHGQRIMGILTIPRGCIKTMKTLGKTSLLLFIGLGLGQCATSDGLIRLAGVWVSQDLGCLTGNLGRGNFVLFRHNASFPVSAGVGEAVPVSADTETGAHLFTPQNQEVKS